MTKISNFIISLALVGFVIGGFGILFNQISSNYAVTYDNSSLDDYQHIQEIYNTSKDLEDEAINIDPNPNPLQELISIIDGFFTGAYNTLVLAWSSFNIFDTIADQTIEDSGVSGEFSNLFKITLGIIIIILIIMGVIVRAIVKAEI